MQSARAKTRLGGALKSYLKQSGRAVIAQPVISKRRLGGASLTTFTFKYDPFGRRIYKSSGSGTSTYTYDGDNLIEETNSSGGVVARYTQTQNIDESLAMDGWPGLSS